MVITLVPMHNETEELAPQAKPQFIFEMLTLETGDDLILHGAFSGEYRHSGKKLRQKAMSNKRHDANMGG